MKTVLLLLSVMFLTGKSDPRELFCEGCIAFLYPAVQADPQNQQKFWEKAVEKVCSNLPFPFDVAKPCYEFLMPVFSKISELMKDGKSAREICAGVGLCRAKDNKFYS